MASTASLVSSHESTISDRGTDIITEAQNAVVEVHDSSPEVLLVNMKADSQAAGELLDGDGALLTANNASTFTPADGANNLAWNPMEEVDAALLSALCDGRERKALLRLEQGMVDFMKDKSSGCMEVGGAFNAIALNLYTFDGEMATAEGQMPLVSQQGQQELQNQQQRGLRQSSFQRLILHRLADRFNIMREQIYHPFGGAGNDRVFMGTGAQQNFSPGLIRLVKTDESLIPSHLLIDIEMPLLNDFKKPLTRSIGGGPDNSREEDAKYITENMALTTLEAQTPVAITSNKKSKKMVIMKRVDSSGDCGGNFDSMGKQKGKLRKNKLSEKAYEEARARIFGPSESSGDNEHDCDENAELGEAGLTTPNQDLPPNLSHSISPVDGNVSNVATSSHAAGTTRHILPSQLITAATLAFNRSSTSIPDLERDNNLPNSASSRSSTFEADNLKYSLVPAAAAGGAVSKAVYRNRQQEENDPDFRRRSDVRSAYVPHVGNPYGPPPGANPYQQLQLPSPQLMAMYHNAPYFYHGQPQHYPTPQDVIYGTATSNPPTQWAYPQGYYPPLQQQPYSFINGPVKRSNSGVYPADGMQSNMGEAGFNDPDFRR